MREQGQLPELEISRISGWHLLMECMPLVPIWRQQPDQVLACSIQANLGIAGDGKLRDGTECSTELRTFLSEAPATYLMSSARFCLENAFPESGLVLQDIINEIGARLEFEVDRGPYRGAKNKTGFDGIWKAPGCRDMVIEVKTTDYINLPLSKLFEYKQRLVKEGKVGPDACVLIVLGREDAGSLADQVRGSRHAFDARLISVEALISLLEVKEMADQENTIAKIRALLQPMDTTRLDDIINIVFSTAQDVVEEPAAEPPLELVSSPTSDKKSTIRTPRQQLDEKREQAVSALGKKLGQQFVRHRITLYKNVVGSVHICAVVSRNIDSDQRKNAQLYWYNYHPRWDEFLKSSSESYVILSCMDRDSAFAIPYLQFSPLIPHLAKTKDDPDRMNWFISIYREEDGALVIRADAGKVHLPLKPFEFPLR